LNPGSRGRDGRSRAASSLDAAGSVDRPRIERAVREILLALGEDPDREELRESPGLATDAYVHLFSGLREDPARNLAASLSESRPGTVLMRGVPFIAVCQHHLVPFVGKAHVAYAPAGSVVGFSELARLVEGYARRPQLQERLTAQIADALHEGLGSRGAFVVLEAEHTCMVVTGAQRPGTIAVTSAARGIYEEDAHLRAEVMAMISGASDAL
jgi:GTP cyclohydrolase IA